jgi:hypothetical protein
MNAFSQLVGEKSIRLNLENGANIQLNGCNFDRLNIPDICPGDIQNQVGYMWGTDNEGNKYCEAISRLDDDAFENNTDWNMYYLEEKKNTSTESTQEEENILELLGIGNSDFNGVKLFGKNPQSQPSSIEMNFICQKSGQEQSVATLSEGRLVINQTSIVACNFHSEFIGEPSMFESFEPIHYAVGAIILILALYLAYVVYRKWIYAENKKVPESSYRAVPERSRFVQEVRRSHL